MTDIKSMTRLFDPLRAAMLQCSAFLIALYYSWHGSTLRIRSSNRTLFPENLKPGENVIYAFWHSKIFSLPPTFGGFGIGILTLRDWKNRIFDKVCSIYGYQTVPVTSPVRAAVRLKDLLEKGHSVAIAVDGPDGPAGVVKPGVLYLSKETNKPIVAVRIRAKKSSRFKARWDRFEVPTPFTEIEITLTEPLQVDERNAEEVKQKVKDFMGDC